LDSASLKEFPNSMINEGLRSFNLFAVLVEKLVQKQNAAALNGTAAFNKIIDLPATSD
jgi:hypothetical protein